MNLVIVESPAKGKTIEKYLGPEYKVVASFGHVRDLPRKELGVDVDKNFEPKYVIIPRSKSVVSSLKNELKKANELILATDFDREGEAIGWHLLQIFNGKLKKKTKRITFTEITKPAIKYALKHPRDIDINLVHSQQTRRILDRLVGYKLSPLLWKKITQGLSAGRVQSVAVRLIAEREKEIDYFVPEEYWQIWAEFEKNKSKFKAQLIKKDKKSLDKLFIKKDSDAKKILDELKKASYHIVDIKNEEVKRHPSPPFITSTLQQEAFHQFRFTAKKTMFLAQQLYEKGYISYHRTDSTNLSQIATNAIRKYIKEKLGEKYLPEQTRIYQTKVRQAQEAHEAIRPTHVANYPEKVKDADLGKDHIKLYKLIWTRTIACQTSEAILDTQKVTIEAKNYTFLAEGQRVKFDGFLKIYPTQIKEATLPALSVKEILKLTELLKEQHFTQAPPRYTEASLIKDLEKEGIGRPSTYAPIISTIKDRGYVGKAKQYLFPQDLGIAVNELLTKNFPDIVDLKFTAKMEDELDDIAEGKKKAEAILKNFWVPFSKNLKEKEKELSKQEITEEETDEICEKCGGKMVIKLGRFGKFLACSNYPKCKFTKAYVIPTGFKCPKCKKGEIIERKNKRGQTFYGCSRFPDCDFATNEHPSKDSPKVD